MTETQLFYLTIMIALLILYLIVCKICDAKETKYKAIAMSSIEAKNITRIDFDNPEDMHDVLEKINNAVNKAREEDNNNE